MQAEAQGATQSKSRLWTGRILSGLAVAFLLLDAVMKLMKVQPVLDAFLKVGWPTSLVIPIGTLLLVCVIVYVIPQTSVLGAILLTGYLGGAVATHVRVGDPLFSHALFPTYIALLLWGGLFLREPRLHALLPLCS
jgi:hypothetical protein